MKNGVGGLEHTSEEHGDQATLSMKVYREGSRRITTAEIVEAFAVQARGSGVLQMTRVGQQHIRPRG